MRRKSDQTRARIIDAAYESFWRAGYARTNLDSIAKRAGVTKRTLYAYFRSKDDLLANVLAQYNTLALQRLQRIGEHMSDSWDGLVDSFFGQLAGWASSTPRWSGSGFTRLVIELADLPGHPARALARRAKSTTEAWLAERLHGASVNNAPERAAEMMLLLEGAMALTLIHGQRGYIDRAAAAAKTLLRRPSQQGAGKKKKPDREGSGPA